MSRAERVKCAQAALDSLKPYFELYKQAEMKLKSEERSFDVGENVIFEEHCQRGCCLEYTVPGTITNIKDNMCTIIKDDGTTRLCSIYDLKLDTKKKS